MNQRRDDTNIGGSESQATPVIRDVPGLRELLTLLFKHRSSIALTFVAVMVVAAGVTFILPPTFSSEARLLVKIGRENVYRSEIGDDKSQVITSNSEEILNSETGILTSRDLAARVISTLTVEQLYPKLAANPPKRGTQLDAAIDRCMEDLTVTSVRKSSILQLAIHHEDPKMAAKALGLLMEFFKEKHLQAYSDPKSSYLEQQLASYDQRLKQSQDQLEAFKQKNAVYSIDEQRTLLLKQRSELDTALKATENDIKQAQQQIASLELSLRTTSPDVPLSTETERYRGVDDAQNQLLELQLKEQELLRKYTDSNQLVVSVRREIQIVRQFIQEQEHEIQGRIRTGQNVVYQDIQRDLVKRQAELPALQAKAGSLRGQVAQLDHQIPALDLTQMDLENLKRDITVNDRNYRSYQEKVKEAQTQEDLNRQKSANISVIQEPTTPTTPIKPRKAVNLGIGMLLGLLAGLGIAFVRELSAQGISTPESAEQRLGVPVLTTVVLKN